MKCNVLFVHAWVPLLEGAKDLRLKLEHPNADRTYAGTYWELYLTGNAQELTKMAEPQQKHIRQNGRYNRNQERLWKEQQQDNGKLTC